MSSMTTPSLSMYSEYDDGDDALIAPLTKLDRLRSQFTKHYTSYVVPKLGICFALLSQFFGSLMQLSSKLIEQDKDFERPLNPFQTIFIRMALTSVVTLSYTWYTKQPDFPFGPKSVRWYLVGRAVSGCLSIYGLFWSIRYISMSANTVIGFLTPVFTVAMAYVALGEKYTIFEAIGAAFSVVGVLLVAQPSFLFPNAVAVVDAGGLESTDSKKRTLGLLVATLGCVFNAFSSIMLRKVGKRCPPVLSVQAMSVASGLFGAVGLLCSPGDGFQMMNTWRQWYLFIQLAASGFLTQFLWTCAIAREKAGRIALLTYFGMIYSIMWEYLIWHHSPGLLTWVGFALIVSSTAGIIYLKPREIDADYDLLEERSSNEFLDDEERQNKVDIAMKDFIVDGEDEEDEDDCGSSVRSKSEP